MPSLTDPSRAQAQNYLSSIEHGRVTFVRADAPKSLPWLTLIAMEALRAIGKEGNAN